MNLLYALAASFAVSLISLVGILALLINQKLLKDIIFLLIAFSAGSLIGSAFLGIIPEAMEHVDNIAFLFLFVLLGYVLFFLFEKYLHWHHHHDEKCDVHMFTYLNVIGDGIHNFCDGLIIGAVFLTDVRVGIATTLAIILHEIPQELGDFAVLIYGGFSRAKALFYNFLSASFAVAGTLVGYFFAHLIGGFSAILLPLAAGGFIYIASCDLIPELRKETDSRKSVSITAAFLLGVALMYGLNAGV
ncbi:MAG: ZIP family metal transporter [Candidatus Omnitrophica bacterium]|nr:ZIP family metal transporter [Candidatus Omnitrophota bacterium]